MNRRRNRKITTTDNYHEKTRIELVFLDSSGGVQKYFAEILTKAFSNKKKCHKDVL